jgi:hypothetical protein
MGLVQLTIGYLVWQRSLYRKVRRLALGYLLLTIILFNISQVSALLAFFLPLKVIFMVASQGIPGYLRFIVTPENKDLSIVLFSLMAICFYFLHILSDYLADVCSQKAAAKILARADKLTLFYNENQLAKDFFLKLSCNIGTILMVVCGFALGLYLNQLLFGALIAVVIVEYVGFGIIWRRFLRPGHLDARLEFVKALPKRLKLLSSLNFFIGFCLLIYVFFKDPNFGLLAGLLSFILFRQIMTRLQVAFQDVLFLHKNRSKIDALFYTHIHYEAPASHTENSFMNMVAPGNRDAWLKELTRYHDIVITGNWTWLDGPGKNVAIFWANEADIEKAIYVKVYGADQTLHLSYEKMILDAFSKKTFLMPSLVSEYTYSGFQMLVYQGLPVSPIQHMGKTLKNAMDEARVAMWQLQPDVRLVSQCSRTKPLLPNRLSEEKLSQLLIAVVTAQEQEQVNRLIDAYDQLRQLLVRMPLFVFNPTLNALNLMMRSDGKPMLFSWTKWSLEPIGVGVPRKIKKVYLENMLKKASEKRRDLLEVTPEMLMMTGYASRLEIAIAGRNYRQGLQIIPDLLNYLGEYGVVTKRHFTSGQCVEKTTTYLTQQVINGIPEHGA